MWLRQSLRNTTKCTFFCHDNVFGLCGLQNAEDLCQSDGVLPRPCSVLLSGSLSADSEFFLFKCQNRYAANSVWQRLLTDDSVLGEVFVQHCGRVAGTLADHPGVLGYELLNKPWPSDVHVHP